MTTNKTFQILSVALLAIAMLFVAPTPASAQLYSMYTTTTSAAVGATDQYVCLSSATNIATQSTTSGGSELYIEHESMNVIGVTSFSTSCFTVIRPQFTSSHPSGATVWFGLQNWFGTADPIGGVNSPCTKTSIYAYPYIVPSTQQIWQCINSQWANGVPQNVSSRPYTFFTTLTIPNNLVAPASIQDVNGKEWFSEIYIPSNVTLTGACWLNGATVGTDKRLAFLADASGAIIANSATAGATTATASGYQCVAFTSTVNVVGPAAYYAGIMTGTGTTDNFYTYTAAGAPTGYGTGVVTGGTFGTITAITPPSSFTTAVGPLMSVY